MPYHVSDHHQLRPEMSVHRERMQQPEVECHQIAAGERRYDRVAGRTVAVRVEDGENDAEEERNQREEID